MLSKRKGLILAGGSGTRLYPATMSVSKQLLPVFDKPMLYYPVATLMHAGIREIAIITTPEDQAQFVRLMGDGSQWGLSITYIEQPSPDGLAQAFILAEDFIDGAPTALILGDNIFYGDGMPDNLQRIGADASSNVVFGYRVSDPERYGVLEFAPNGQVLSIVEKPEVPASNYAVTGLYFLDGSAPARAKLVKPSARGELEIVSLLETYLHDGLLNVEILGRGSAWFDTGTHDSLLEASEFVRTLQRRQGVLIGSLDEISFRNGWTNGTELKAQANLFKKNQYGQMLGALLN